MKKQFKQKVLRWLKRNKVDISGRKIRVFDSPRYGLEVRIYGQPMEMPNSRKSFRERKEERDEQRHGTYGIHSRKIAMYVHINEKDLKDKEEQNFILENIKNL